MNKRNLDKRNLMVLLAEDDQNVRATMRAMLYEMGVTQIFESQDGQDASDFISSGAGTDVDLVICDWNMPNKTGVEFLKDLRTISPSVPFIMITARADQNSVIDAKEAGVSAYVCKPFTYKELKSKVDTLLRAP